MKCFMKLVRTGLCVLSGREIASLKKQNNPKADNQVYVFTFESHSSSPQLSIVLLFQSI